MITGRKEIDRLESELMKKAYDFHLKELKIDKTFLQKLSEKLWIDSYDLRSAIKDMYYEAFPERDKYKNLYYGTTERYYRAIHYFDGMYSVELKEEIKGSVYTRESFMCTHAEFLMIMQEKDMQFLSYKYDF